MNLIINNEPFEHEGAPFVEALVEALGAKKAHTALLLNDSILSAENWKNTALKEGDRVDLLVFVGGG